MSNTVLKTAVQTQLAVRGWKNTVVTRMAGRERSQGQTAFEYLGIILVVIAIIGGIVGLGIGTSITTRIGKLVDQIKAG
ncbi:MULTISPECIES: hypothetical protein [unclassified Streptomyces]|uniref:hypothetical protein n=1 Tax=unclassified Streptomyces TaxID=2593676 RepID=UPI002E309771|nr:hypothetical protein [Streptomyces sp. NBC_01460]WSS27137.1 hypothetical protein OG770_13350 [Streptomyces sp. NBC_01185]